VFLDFSRYELNKKRNSTLAIIEKKRPERSWLRTFWAISTFGLVKQDLTFFG